MLQGTASLRLSCSTPRVQDSDIEMKAAAMLGRLFAGIWKTVRSAFRSRSAAAASPSRRDDPDEGAVGVGVTVPIKPSPPVLVGKEAKAIPSGDDHAEKTEDPRLAA